ncbi:hypothetical protein BH23THE1_BH23THE1_33330 [soil metagenome]
MQYLWKRTSGGVLQWDKVGLGYFVIIAQDNLNLIIDTIFRFMIRFYECNFEIAILDKRYNMNSVG